MPFSLHPDLRATARASYLISQEGMIFNFYDFNLREVETKYLEIDRGVDIFNYPPLGYLVFAPFMKLLSSFYPWELFQTFVNNMERVYGDPGLPGLLFLLKTPFLIFDIVGLLLIGQLFTDPKRRFWSQMIWLFNPVTIYVSYMIGQSDLFIAVFILAALVLSAKEKYIWAAVFLGLGAGIKLFPLLLLPFLAIYGGKNIVERVKIFAGGILAYSLLLLPYLPSPGFRQYALVASQTDKMLFAKIPVSGAEFLPLFLVLFVFVVWWCWTQPARLKLWQWFLVVLLAFFALVHYHPQWFVWMVPLLILLVVSDSTRKFTFPVTVLLLCYTIIVFMFDSSLNIGLFSVVNPYLSQISLGNLIAGFYEPNVFSSIIRGIFAGTALFISIHLFKDKKIHG